MAKFELKSKTCTTIDCAREETQVIHRIGDKIYTSASEISRDFNISVKTFNKRIANGESASDAVQARIHPNSKEIEVEGVVYESITEAALEYNLNPSTVINRLSVNDSTEEIFLQKKKEKTSRYKQEAILFPKKIKGKMYKRISDAAKDYNVGLETLRHRLCAGETLIKALEGGLLIFTINNKTFKNKSAAARFYMVSLHTMLGRLRRGWTEAQATGLESPPLKKPSGGNSKSLGVTIKGQQFKSITSAAKHFGMHRSTLTLRLEKGLKDDDLIKKADLNGSTNRKPQSIKIDNRNFPSFSAVSRHFGVSIAIIRYRYSKGARGKTLINPATKRTKAISVTINKKYFPSLGEAAKYHGINCRTMTGRYKRGLRGKDLIS